MPGRFSPLSFLDQMSGMNWQENVKDQLAQGTLSHALAGNP